MSQGVGSLAVAQVQDANYPPVTSSGLSAKTTQSAWKEPCAVASSASIANLSNVLLTDFDGTGQGITLGLGDRVLVKNTASPDGVAALSGKYNGIYTVASLSADGLHGALVYDQDANASICYSTGQMVPVARGTYAASLWMLTTANPITLGTTVLTYAAPTLG